MDIDPTFRRYFLLRGSFEPAVLGNQTGTKQAVIKRSGFRNPEEFDRLYADLGTLGWRRFHNGASVGDYDIQCVEMYKKSKLTDFLQFAPGIIACEFMISDKVRQILSAHRLMSVSNFPVRVKRQDGKFFSYWLLFVAPVSPAMIDFPCSSFYTGSALSGKKMLNFESYEEMLRECDHGTIVNEEKIVLKPSFPEVDLFLLFGRLIVSENLKNVLEEHDATSGVDVIDASEHVISRVG